MSYARVARFALVLAVLVVPATRGVCAGARLEIDGDTLNRLLAAAAVTEVQVPLTQQRSLPVQLRDLAVTGLEPVAGASGSGFIRTAVRVVAPDIGLDVALRPRIALNVVEHGGQSLLELRFEEVAVRFPLVGPIDIAGLIPPMRYPADNVWLLTGSAGDVEVVSRLTSVEMSPEAIRFEFSVDVPGSP